MFTWLGKLKVYAIEFGAVLLAVLLALAAGFRKGEKSASNADAAKAAKVTADAITKSNEVKRRIDAMSPEQIDKEADKWSRD